MGNPEAPGALEVADNLDDIHRATAVRQGREALSTVKEMAAEAKARRLAQCAEVALEVDSLQTV